MKKSLVLFAMMLALSTLLVGCPQPTQVNIPSEMGKVVVGGNLYDDSATKSTNLNEVVGDFIGRANRMSFLFYNGNDQGISFEVTVKDGQYSGSFLLPVGDYYVYTTIKNVYGNILFYSHGKVSVSKGQVSKLDIIFNLVESFSHSFQIAGLPGGYPEYGEALIIGNNGQTYPGYYYRYYGDKGKSLDIIAEGQMVFQFWLPTDFDAAEQGAYLLVNDVYGEPYAASLDFTVFDTIEPIFRLDYVPAENVGMVDVTIGFVHYETIGGKG